MKVLIANPFVSFLENYQCHSLTQLLNTSDAFYFEILCAEYMVFSQASLTSQRMLLLHFVTAVLISLVLFAGSPSRAVPVAAFERYPLLTIEDIGFHPLELARSKKWTRLEPSIRFIGGSNPYFICDRLELLFADIGH
uniref:Uncharacterized protein n=1 Tax=Ascaris lumbricoides TaxID=6252 RepID=A0A0M3IAH7_ASCLU